MYYTLNQYIPYFSLKPHTAAILCFVLEGFTGSLRWSSSGPLTLISPRRSSASHSKVSTALKEEWTYPESVHVWGL